MFKHRERRLMSEHRKLKHDHFIRGIEHSVMSGLAKRDQSVIDQLKSKNELLEKHLVFLHKANTCVTALNTSYESFILELIQFVRELVLDDSELLASFENLVSIIENDIKNQK